MGAYKKEKKKKRRIIFLTFANQTRERSIFFSFLFFLPISKHICETFFFPPYYFFSFSLFLLQPNSELGGKEHSISNNSVWQNGGEEKGEAERGIKGNRRERKIVGYKGNSGRKWIIYIVSSFLINKLKVKNSLQTD